MRLKSELLTLRSEKSQKFEFEARIIEKVEKDVTFYLNA